MGREGSAALKRPAISREAIRRLRASRLMPLDLLVARRGRSTSDTSPMRRATSRGAILAANALRSERHLKEHARREARRCSPRGSSTSSTHSSGSPAHKGADFRLLCARCLPRVRQVPSSHSAGLVRARAQTHRVDGIVVARRRRADGARTLPLCARRRGGQRAHHVARVPRVCARLSVSACEPRGRALPRTIARRAFASALSRNRQSLL